MPSGAAAERSGMLPPSQPPAEQVWIETQPSQVGGGMRKASMALLAQDGAAKRRRHAAPAASESQPRMQLRSRRP